MHDAAHDNTDPRRVDRRLPLAVAVSALIAAALLLQWMAAAPRPEETLWQAVVPCDEDWPGAMERRWLKDAAAYFSEPTPQAPGDLIAKARGMVEADQAGDTEFVDLAVTDPDVAARSWSAESGRYRLVLQREERVHTFRVTVRRTPETCTARLEVLVTHKAH